MGGTVGMKYGIGDAVEMGGLGLLDVVVGLRG